MTCVTIKYNSLDRIATLAPTHEVIIVIDGTPHVMTIADFLTSLGVSEPILQPFHSLAAARKGGIMPRQKFKASNPNKMSVPPGTVIEMS